MLSRFALILAALVVAIPSFGADAATYLLAKSGAAAQTPLDGSSQCTEIVNASRVLRKDAITATLQAEATGAPSSCTMILQGRLDGMTNFIQVGGSSASIDCTSPGALSFYGLAFDDLRACLTALSGGTSPTVAASLRVVSQ